MTNISSRAVNEWIEEEISSIRKNNTFYNGKKLPQKVKGGLIMEKTEEKLTFKEKVADFKEKHPKIVKALKVVGLVAVGAGIGAAGTAYTINKQNDDEMLLENDEPNLIDAPSDDDSDETK